MFIWKLRLRCTNCDSRNWSLCATCCLSVFTRTNNYLFVLWKCIIWVKSRWKIQTLEPFGYELPWFVSSMRHPPPVIINFFLFQSLPPSPLSPVPWPTPQLPIPSSYHTIPRCQRLSSLTLGITHSIIHGLIFYLNTCTVWLHWDTLWGFFTQFIHVPSRSHRRISSAICIHSVIKSCFFFIYATRDACQIEVFSGADVASVAQLYPLGLLYF